MLKPSDQWRWQPDSGHQDECEMSAYWQAGGLDWRHIAARLPESHAMEPQQQGDESDKQTADERDREPGRAREGRTHDQKLAHEHAEGRQTGDGENADDQAPAEHRMGHGQAPDIGDLLRALDLRYVTDGEEDRRLRQAVHD